MLVFASLLKLDAFSFHYPGTRRISLPVLGHLSVDIAVGKTPSTTDSVGEMDLPQALFWDAPVLCYDEALGSTVTSTDERSLPVGEGCCLSL